MDMDEMLRLLPALLMGLGLAAACGFRVFLPLLVCGLAVRFGDVSVGAALAWTGSNAGLCCLGVAVLMELLAYYIPYVDHLLDLLNTPLCLVAGALMMSGMLPQLPEYLQWGIGILGGATVAGVVQGGTVGLRAASTATTGGLGNFLVSSLENVMALVASILSIVLPFVAFAFLLLLVAILLRVAYRRRQKKAEQGTAPTA